MAYDRETKRPRFVLIGKARGDEVGAIAWETKRPRFVLIGKANGLCHVHVNEDETARFVSWAYAFGL